ncbi:MAG: YolD-like family protein [Bacilli bacterium]|nr:YolD-like family protein [Acholeplasmataceae bacterium]MDY2903139.1 YolD-like family protein [Bacilli bacterium]
MANRVKADRAKIFLPFDGLKGFKEALREKEKIKVAKKILSQEEKDNISYKLLQINKGNIIKIIYYEDGEYLEIEGMVSSIDYVFKTITIVYKKIDFNNILEIKGENNDFNDI